MPKNSSQPTPDYKFPESPTPPKAQSGERAELAMALTEQLRRYKDSRQGREDTWLRCWQNYLGTPSAVLDLRSFDLAQVGGSSSTYWRHKVHKPKAFESVETVVGYLVGAFFPNREYATLTPTMPGVADLEPAVTKFFLNKLDESGLKGEWSLYLRQLAITGNSMIALPWRKESRPERIRQRVEGNTHDEGGLITELPSTKLVEVERITYNAPEFEIINCFDYWLDPNNPHPQRANMFRRIRRTKGELLLEISKGLYPYLNDGQVMSHACNVHGVDRPAQVQSYQGQEWWPDQEVELFEFWGDADTGKALYKDVRVVLLGDTVAAFERNQFWGGRPFIAGTYTPIVDTPYGMGVIEPALGALHELDSITNQRLDNAELSLNGMFTHRADGLLRTEDIYTEPGRVLAVADHDTLRPLPTPNPNFGVSYQEAQILEADIDKSTGTGSFIGVGAGRSGERVTAEEIQATRDAGGNRLTSVYTWIEHSAFTPLLNRVWQGIRQFVTDDQVIRMSVNTPSGPKFVFIELEPTDLSQDFAVKPRGAGHIADKEYELNKRLQFLDLVGANPDMAAQLDWTEVMKDLASRFGYDDFERFLKAEEPAPEQAQPQPGGGGLPVSPLVQEMLPGQTGVPLVDEFMQEQGAIGNAPAIAEEGLALTGAASPEDAAAIREQLEQLPLA